MKNRTLFVFGAVLLILFLSPFLGEQFIGIDALLHNDQAAYIFINYRIPRVLLAFLAGAGLSVAGLIFQSLFCNVLATPYTLGISTAASFGALLAMATGVSFSIGIFDQTVLFAIVFASISMGFIYLVSRKYAEGRMSDVLLIGVALNFLFSSLIMLIQFRLDYLNAFKFMHWLFGSIRNVSFEVVIFEAIILVIALSFVFLLRKELDLLSLGEEFAQSRGVNVLYVRWVLILVGSLTVGSVVSFFGPVAFVGLIVPNISRMVVGVVHKRLVVATVFIGGSLLVFADVLSRVLFSPVELPVGIFTSFIGAGAFFFLVLARRR